MVLLSTTYKSALESIMTTLPTNDTEGATLNAAAFRTYMEGMTNPSVASGQHDSAEQDFISALPDGYAGGSAGLQQLKQAYLAYVTSVHLGTVGPGVGDSFSPPVGFPMIDNAANLDAFVLAVDTWVRTGLYVQSTGPVVTVPWL